MSARLSPAQVAAALRRASTASPGAAPSGQTLPGQRPPRAAQALGAGTTNSAPQRGAKAPAAPAAQVGSPALRSGAGEIRIIGGQWKRTRLPVPHLPGLRPTPDRVRETLFNWLGQDLSGWRCLDAFSGTGALGLEAASRGAASVCMVEQDAALVARLQGLCQRLQASAVQVRRGDGVAQLRQCAPASLDLVFIDPPFDGDLFLPALQAAAAVLAPQGFIYLEAPTAWADAELAPLGLALQRHLRAGAVHAHLLRPIAKSHQI